MWGEKQMNLSKLFETQKKLDERIVKEKGLEGQDLLDKKILALQVELGELANEARFFKFWSTNQEPRKIERTPYECGMCEGRGFDDFLDEHCEECDGEGMSGEYNEEYPLLEEFVDCLHFFLSIGNDLKVEPDQHFTAGTLLDIMAGFMKINRRIAEMWWDHHDKTGDAIIKWFFAFRGFLGLGEHFGFTPGQIEQAYYEKNQINHDRQESGY